MKQPDLGKKIAELRKAKGLTQEELVEMCNISVRTIQRIETGEVMPRSYTVKTILGALEADLGKILEHGEEEKTVKVSPLTIKHLNLAWIMGIAYFVLGIPESVAEYYRYSEGDMIFSSTAYISFKVLVLVAYVFFQRGFVIIGALFNNYLLKIVSLLLIGVTLLMMIYDIFSVFYSPFNRELALFGEALSFGGIGIIYGLALFRLKNNVGTLAIVAGVFEILAAVFFLTVFLSVVGLIILIPAELAEIIIIYKTVDLLKAKALKPSLA